MKIKTYANEAGLKRVRLIFGNTLSETDPRPEFNLQSRWPELRRKARTALVRAIAEREQRTDETRKQAEALVRASLGKLEVIEQSIDSLNRLGAVTFGER